MKQSTHKWLLPGILCFAFLSAFVATAATKASHGASPESLGTFNYDVRYKNGLINAKVATATITWEESKWQNRPAYHSSALVKATPVFALFISSDYVAETYFSHSGLAPLLSSIRAKRANTNTSSTKTTRPSNRYPSMRMMNRNTRPFPLTAARWTCSPSSISSASST